MSTTTSLIKTQPARGSSAIFILFSDCAEIPAKESLKQ